MRIIPPGAVIGILGGGQLGRMTALAAARLGYRCHIFCPGMDAPALQVAAAHTAGAFNDEAALKKFADSVDVITLEWENVPLAALEFLARHKPVHPGSKLLGIAQDRVAEKSFARQHGIGTADFIAVNSAAELAAALQTIKPPAILKSTRMGYDGKGQVMITPAMDAATAWREMGSEAGILEAFVDFSCEVSVLVARRADGGTAHYPVVENIHSHHILAETHAPARVIHKIAEEAEHLACQLAAKLELVGLLGVEMFVLKEPNAEGHRVVMNEIAPRPHNSGHWTMDACSCDQFEQLVRAICGLPLGSTVPHSRAVMHNLLGRDIDRWPEFLADPLACLHLYGKATPREGRKMGHVNFLRGKW